eukprot:1160952-Lingulodinium_polyedra.AAC.1
MDLRELPPGLPHSRVEFLTTTYASHGDTILGEVDAVRDGHAKATWQCLAKRTVAARPKALQAEGTAAPHHRRSRR